MTAIRRHYPDICPTGPSAYSRAVRSGNFLFIAGCTARGTDAQGGPLLDQLRVVLDRVTRIVAAEGGSPADIVKTTTYVTDMDDWQAHIPEEQALFKEFFQGEYPANTLIGISTLSLSDLHVEIEATVLLS